METISRRNILRVVGGAGAGALAAPALVDGLAAPAHAGRAVLRGKPTSIARAVSMGVPLIGMSAPADVWDERVDLVGSKIRARRIFADLGRGPGSQLRLVEQAHAAGQLPVISYKVGGDVTGAINGRFDAVAAEAARRLAAFDKPTAVAFWHEPHGDLTPAEYVAASRRLLPAFKRGRLKVGPILNGWLLDRQVDTFESYTSADLFRLWDWFGIDTYESGTAEAPGPRKPADRIKAVSRFVRSRGLDLPLGVGEYNGYSARSIKDAGKALMETPDVWFGCMWNAEGDRGWELSGARLDAFRATVKDAKRARRAVRRAARRR